MPIGGMPRQQEQENAGQELRQSDQSQIQGLLGDFIDLPADGDGLHFERSHDEKPCDLVERKIRIRKETGSFAD
jgi:hypothetical protein